MMPPTHEVHVYENRDRLEEALHDLTNALASARAYGEVLSVRAKAGVDRDPSDLIDALLEELDRVSEISRAVRLSVYKEYLTRSHDGL